MQLGSSVYIATYTYIINGISYQRTMYDANPDMLDDTFEIEYDPENPLRNSVPNQTIYLKNPTTWIPRLVIGLMLLALLYFGQKYL
jgi:hypothetical protein